MLCAIPRSLHPLSSFRSALLVIRFQEGQLKIKQNAQEKNSQSLMVYRQHQQKLGNQQTVCLRKMTALVNQEHIHQCTSASARARTPRVSPRI